MHTWDDKDVDWDGINDAARYIGEFSLRWALLGGQTKEKYGSVRFYAQFGNLNLHTLMYPGYVYRQFPKWLWKLDCSYIGPFLQFIFGKPFVGWQKMIYRMAYKNAIKKWPHLRKEILCAADQEQLLVGL